MPALPKINRAIITKASDNEQMSASGTYAINQLGQRVSGSRFLPDTCSPASHIAAAHGFAGPQSKTLLVFWCKLLTREGPLERGLAAILVADVVGWRRLMERDSPPYEFIPWP